MVNQSPAWQLASNHADVILMQAFQDSSTEEEQEKQHK